jgi:putative sigma-54 modulation protein
MHVQLFGRNLEVTPRLQAYVEKKVGKLDHYLPEIEEVRMDVAVEHARSSTQRQIAQLTVRTRGTILRAEERSADIYSAIDAALDKMRRQISRYKTRRQDRWQRAEPEETQTDEETQTGEIVRVKRFEVLPMTPVEAVEQMELLGHQFFVFFNTEEGGLNVVYRRWDGDYGLIVPEVG